MARNLTKQYMQDGLEFINSFTQVCLSGTKEDISNYIDINFSQKNPLKKLQAMILGDDFPKLAVKSALMQLCLKDKIEEFKFLFQNPKTSKYIDLISDYSSLFRGACKSGKYEIVEYILTSNNVKRKPDINVGVPEPQGKIGVKIDYTTITDIGSGSPLMLACENFHNDIVSLLLNHAKINQRMKDSAIEDAFCNSLSKGNIEGARIILNNSNIANNMFDQGNVLKEQSSSILQLYYAITNNNYEIVDFLLDECKVVYQDYFEHHNLEAHEKLKSIILNKELETNLSTSNKKNTRMKI